MQPQSTEQSTDKYDKHCNPYIDSKCLMKWCHIMKPNVLLSFFFNLFKCLFSLTLPTISSIHQVLNLDSQKEPDTVLY